jgi:hypothetical protein
MFSHSVLTSAVIMNVTIVFLWFDHPTEVMFCGLLDVSQASDMQLVFGIFAVGPGLFGLSSYIWPPLIFLFMCPLYTECN